MLEYQKQFIDYALQCGVLKFGQFTLKSGRLSPYFFNTGLFDTGAKLAKLGEFYAQALLHSQKKIDILYGPAYKGIPLVCATSIAYAQASNEDIPFAFNRKEAKDHGEGGSLVGSPLKGNVVILDDVITAGTSVRESVAIINAQNANAVAVLIALDRQETGENGLSAIKEVSHAFQLEVMSIISLAEIISYLKEKNCHAEIQEIIKYREQYGV